MYGCSLRWDWTDLGKKYGVKNGTPYRGVSLYNIIADTCHLMIYRAGSTIHGTVTLKAPL